MAKKKIDDFRFYLDPSMGVRGNPNLCALATFIDTVLPPNSRAVVKGDTISLTYNNVRYTWAVPVPVKTWLNRWDNGAGESSLGVVPVTLRAKDAIQVESGEKREEKLKRNRTNSMRHYHAKKTSAPAKSSTSSKNVRQSVSKSAGVATKVKPSTAPVKTKAKTKAVSKNGKPIGRPTTRTVSRTS